MFVGGVYRGRERREVGGRCSIFFPFSVNNSFSIKKTRKSKQRLPELFSDFHVSTSFHYDWTNNKKVEYGNDDKSWRHYVCRKTALLICISFTTSIETSAHSFWAKRLILVSNVADWSALQKYWEFFFIIRFFFKKIRPPEVKNFYDKIIFFKTRNNSKTRIKYEKISLYFCRRSNSSSIEINMTL